MSNLLSKPTTLYVIGNGFDQHHNIPCSYIDFRDWMKDNCSDVYDNFLRIYGTCTDGWWSTFEENLTNFNPDIYPNEIAMFLTFNYTKTLEDLCGVDDDNVLHIHGSVDRGNFVIGHNMTAEEMIDRDLEEHAIERNPEKDKGEDEARLGLFDVIADELKKPVDDLIVENRHYFNSLEGLKKLIVLGFS